MSELISLLGTTREQVTVSGMMLVFMVAEGLVIRALWKDRTRREDYLDAITRSFADLAGKYDTLATSVSQRFDELVGHMSRKFFGE